MTRIKVVIGCGFGDEGKGQTTYALCNDIINSKNVTPAVYRFSGGQQAGHTVTTKSGLKHVFSCFGSGTFLNCPTVWGEKCTMDPLMWFVEREKLISLMNTIPARQYFHPNVCITTPFDVIHNIQNRKGNTVGKGIWETVKRNREGLNLFYGDLRFPEVVKIKLECIYHYYLRNDISNKNKYDEVDIDKITSRFLDFYVETFMLHNAEQLFPYIVYEGSQGILLDPKYGLNGHEYTTPISCMPDFLRKHSNEADIYYVTRSYLTKHGDGSAHSQECKIVNPYETNINNQFQGNFKTYILNRDLISYAISCVERSYRLNTRYLVQTCCDVYPKNDVSTRANYSILNLRYTYSPDFDTLCK